MVNFLDLTRVPFIFPLCSSNKIIIHQIKVSFQLKFHIVSIKKLCSLNTYHNDIIRTSRNRTQIIRYMNRIQSVEPRSS